jgi:hypothetical protein
MSSIGERTMFRLEPGNASRLREGTASRVEESALVLRSAFGALAAPQKPVETGGAGQPCLTVAWAVLGRTLLRAVLLPVTGRTSAFRQAGRQPV